MEAGNSKIKVCVDSMCDEGLVAGSWIYLSAVCLYGGRAGQLSEASFVRAPLHSSGLYLPNTTTLGVGFQHSNVGGAHLDQ